MIESATEFRKSGYSDEDSAILAEIAAKFQNVADSQISAGDASSFIISQMIAFGIAAEDAESIIDKVNEVSNRFAVSSTDLSKGLNIVASTSASMGNSIDETLAILTAITEETRNASKASRGMNTIFANLAQVLDDASSNGEKISEIFDTLNVSMYNSDGQLKSGYDLIEGLSSKWGSLDTNYQNYIASTIAGTNQLNNFLALMNNFPHAVDAVGVSLNSAGSAAQENERVMESISSKITQLQASFQQLATSIVDSELVKLLVDIANALLQLANTDIGRFVTQVGLISGVLWGGKGLLNAMKIIPNLFGMAGTAVSKFEKILNISAPKLAAIATAIAVIVNLVPKVIDWFKKLNPSLEDLEEEAGTLEEQLSANKDRLKEIEKIPWNDRTSDIIRETEELKKENAELEKKLGLLKEDINKETASDIRERYSTEAPGYLVDTPSFFRGYENAEALIEDLKELGYLSKDFVGNIDDVRKALAQYGGSITETQNYTKTFESSLITLIERYNELWSKLENNTATADEKEEFRLLASTIRDLDTEISNTDGILNEFSESERKQIGIIGQLNAKYDEAISLSYRYNDSIDGADNILSALIRNQTIDANQKDILLKKYPQLIEYIYQSGEGYAFSTDALRTLAGTNEAWAKTTLNNIGKVLEAQMIATERTKNHAIAISRYQFLMGDRNAKDPEYLKAKEAAVEAATAYENAAQAYKDYQFALQFPLKKKEEDETITPTGGGGSSKSAADKLKEIFDKEYKALENQFKVLQEKGASLEDLLAHLQKMQDTLHSQANAYRKIGLKEDSEYITDRQKLWWEAQKEKKESTKDWYEAQYQDAEHELLLLEKNGATAQQLNEKRLAMQKLLHEQANRYRKLGLKENDEYIKEIQEEWYKLRDEIIKASKEWAEEQVKIEKEAAEKRKKIQQNLINYLKETTQSNIENEIEELEKVRDEWQNKADAYEAYADLMQEHIDKEIEAIQKELDALDKSNEELEDKIALEEKLDALARARSQKVMVYKDGQWQYIEDIDAVSQAEADLEEYNREQSLKEQRKALEDQIAILEKYKDEWSDLAKDYEYWQKKRLIEEALGINLENHNFNTMLGNAQSFAEGYTNAMKRVSEAVDSIEAANKRLELELKKYEEMLKKLEGTSASSSSSTGNKVGNAISNVVGGVVGGSVGSAINQAGNMIGTGINTALDILKNASSSGSSSSGIDWSAKWWEAENNPNLSASDKKALQDAYHAAKEEEMKGTGKKYNSATGKWYAQGTLNAQAGISLVGEKGPELRVLNQGDGILPSDITQNLWQWGTLSPSQLFSSFKDKASQWINLTIQNLNLPQVKDGPDFVNYLTNNFMRTVIQNNV